MPMPFPPLGISSLDEQHEALSGMLKAFQLALAARRPASEISTIITTALAALRAHFQHEEALMARSGYAHASAHRFEHERLMLAIQSLANDALEQRRTPDVLADNGELLRGLFRDHVTCEDRVMADHLLSLAAG